MDAAKATAAEAYRRQPLAFEPNVGQGGAAGSFVAKGAGYQVSLGGTEAIIALRPTSEAASGAAVRLSLLGANPSASMAGIDPLAGTVNYVQGSDPAGWKMGLPTYGKVSVDDAYPGIDAVYYGNGRELEYDFVVAPGADPAAIRLNVEGAAPLHLDEHGALLLDTPAGTLAQRPPVVYQEIDGKRQPVDGGYVLGGPGEVGFRLGAYDHSRPLVIDPSLDYSTYLGGSLDEAGLGIAVDGAGNAYVTGFTRSSNFPQLGSDHPLGGVQDAFVTKLTPTGNLSYSTYLGGSVGGGDASESGNGIAVDSAGHAYVTGFTNSEDFPTLHAYQGTKHSPGTAAFVTELSPTGAPVYSTYLSGNNFNTTARGIALTDGRAVVVGETNSATFPTTDGSKIDTHQFLPEGTQNDVFVTEFNGAGSALNWSTVIGGTAHDRGRGVATDSKGNTYITGETVSPANDPNATPPRKQYPTTAPGFQLTPSGGFDAFVTKFDDTGERSYSTLLGGTGDDNGNAISVGNGESAYVTGGTKSANFPTTAGVFQPARAGAQDTFVTKLNTTGTALTYSTYLGGSTSGGGLTLADDVGRGIAVDDAGKAWVTGSTRSTNFPTAASPLKATLGGVEDAFVTQLAASGASLAYSTYLGGASDVGVLGGDGGQAIATDPADSAYVTGFTPTTDFPTLNPAQAHLGGAQDGFVTKFTIEGIKQKASPTLTTNASDHVPLGGAIYDQATLTGGDNPTGSIIFRLYGPDNPTCAEPTAFVSTRKVSDNGRARSADFTPTVAGTYRWQANYSGDLGNNAVGRTPCGEPSEMVVVGGTQPTYRIEGKAIVSGFGYTSDTATIIGGVNPRGSVTFSLYGPNNATCTGTPLLTHTKFVDSSNRAISRSLKPPGPGTYRWVVSYAGDDHGNGPLGPTPCGDPAQTVVIP